jgi:hypothetical protein
VAVDSAAGNLYWTDPGARTVEAASLANGGRLVLHSDGVDSPRGMAVVPAIG